MNKFVSIIVLVSILVMSCSTASNLDRFTSFKEVNVSEDIGWEYRELQGLVFRINAKGDEKIDATEIRRLALTRASTVARDKGFQAFTVLKQNTGVVTETKTVFTGFRTEYQYRTEYASRNVTTEIATPITVPQTAQVPVNVNYCDLLIGLITEADYKKVDNVFLVSDYLSSQ